jgi:hypothetical protein
MKKLSNMMLAAVAAAAIATPAMAWDFSASGSTSGRFVQKTETPDGGDATTTANFEGSSGGVSIMSSHADGDNTLTLKYTIDYDGDAGGLDETISLSASTKVGNWTTTGTASQSKMENGNHIPDNVGADDGAHVKITDGTMTHTLGDAAHLSAASKGADSGAVDYVQGAAANVDGFKGYSLGYKVDDATSVTFAIHMQSTDNTTDPLGSDALPLTLGVANQLTAYGLSVGTMAGPASIDFTFGTASAAPKEGDEKGASSTMALGVSADVGAAVVFLDYESAGSTVTVTGGTETKTTTSGYEIGATVPLDDSSSVVINLSNDVTKVGDGDAVTDAATEVGYKTSVGAATLEVGYASLSDGQTADTADTTSELAVKMSYSF